MHAIKGVKIILKIIISLSWSQSYKNLISSFFRFLLLSLSVCSIRKYCLCYNMAKLNSEKQKKSSFYEEKSLVGLTLDLNRWNRLYEWKSPYFNTHLYGVGKTLGRTLPDDGQNPFEVCFVQFLFQNDQILVQIVDQRFGITTWSHFKGIYWSIVLFKYNSITYTK